MYNIIYYVIIIIWSFIEFQWFRLNHLFFLTTSSRKQIEVLPEIEYVSESSRFHHDLWFGPKTSLVSSTVIQRWQQIEVFKQIDNN